MIRAGVTVAGAEALKVHCCEQSAAAPLTSARLCTAKNLNCGKQSLARLQSALRRVCLRVYVRAVAGRAKHGHLLQPPIVE